MSRRVHFPSDGNLIANIYEEKESRFAPDHVAVGDTNTSHLCGKFSSPFRVGGRGAKLLSKVISPSAFESPKDSSDCANESHALCFEEPMCFFRIVSSNSPHFSIVQPLRPARDPSDNMFILCTDGHFRTVKKDMLMKVQVCRQYSLFFLVIVMILLTSACFDL